MVVRRIFLDGLFTAALTGSTALLWRETRRLAEGADDQAAKMAASIAVAEKAANAAQLSANTAISVELPYLRALEMKTFMNLLIGRNGWKNLSLLSK
jgi:hypothetical protein